MRVGVVGINHKLANLKLRDHLAKVCQRRFGANQSTHGDHHFVLLSTCNRTEIYFCSNDLTFTHTYLLNILRNEVEEDFDQKLYSYFGQDCFLHLSRVTAGLDSAIIAETEIQGQVKSAYESSAEYTYLPEDLHYLFQKSLKIGKKLRSDLPMGRGLPDLEHAVFNTGMELFKNSLKPQILFIGASDINKKIINFINAKNTHTITICNRSLDKAKNFADTYRLLTLGWDKVINWHAYDWIILGTKAPEYLCKFKDLPSHEISQKLIIDLSVPRNADPQLGRHPKITLLNIDQINRTLKLRRDRMNDMLFKAEHLVTKEINRQIHLFHQKEKNRQQFLAIGA